MMPKKNLIERAKANGSIQRLNILLSAAHILNCESNSFLQEAAELMEQNGLMLGRLKQLHNSFIKSADNYFKEFASMVDTEESKMDMFNDMDSFDTIFRKWSKVEKNWEPKTISGNGE